MLSPKCPAKLREAESLLEMASLAAVITKKIRTAADGEKHDATLAMDLDGTRHPLKEPLSGQLRV